MENKGEILLYQSEEGIIKIDVRLEGEKVWFTQKLMAELFQTMQKNITIHLKKNLKKANLINFQLVRIS